MKSIPPLSTACPAIVPELLDSKQAAQLLNIGRNQVYELAHCGRLPHIKLGQRLRFPRTALLRWIEQEMAI
ncbi:helix-turn-helix domain-containing protein [Deinococcus sp. Arct2-2]|uniref:helix-turn-helix domain-containing protein n=1 Tax=Deinococcus sp. Arct2-2 TaxID=2568653 RepID=UPI0010A2CFC0|nr:helix-turn-helix domain-containing protein [Deinococcus sp. Arct2-2]THF70147.1 helix-turn-helix domain-containing protein [Deinococcus sp. Arct2-2]